MSAGLLSEKTRDFVTFFVVDSAGLLHEKARDLAQDEKTARNTALLAGQGRGERGERERRGTEERERGEGERRGREKRPVPILPGLPLKIYD